jgi:hypothetical protein
MVCLLNKPKPYGLHSKQTCYPKGNVKTYVVQIPLLMLHVLWYCSSFKHCLVILRHKQQASHVFMLDSKLTWHL